MKKIFLNHLKPLVFLWSTIGVYFAFLFQHIILLNEKGLSFGHEYVWSDWPLHVAIANIFALKNPSEWFSYHPLYAQGEFTYPFLADFISGFLMRINLPLTFSFIFPSIVTVLSFITISYFLFYSLFKSRKIALLSIFIFLLSSGPGFVNFLVEFIRNPQIESLIYPRIEYSKALAYEWGSGNVVTGLLIPQRAFLLGITLGTSVLLGLTLFLNQHVKNKLYSRTVLFLSGIVAGILPIAHPHSFIAIVVITGLICFFNLKKIKELSFFFITATLTSFFFYFRFISGGIENQAFIAFMPGWTANGVLDFVHMWWTLWGIATPVAILSFFMLYKKRSEKNLVFFLGFIVLFILANIIKFQPTAWDNSKLFFWAYFGFSALSAFVIVELYKKTFVLKTLAVVLFLLLTLTGVLELTRLARVDKNTYVSISKDDLTLAEEIRSKTDSSSIFLTGTTHDNLVMVWAARPILMGYAGWVNNFGFNYHQTEQDIYKIYQGDDKTRELIRSYNVKYILIGPWEKQHLDPDTGYFINNFPVVFSNKNNLIFEVN